MPRSSADSSSTSSTAMFHAPVPGSGSTSDRQPASSDMAIARAGGRGLLRLDQNAAHLEKAVDRREPELGAPRQTGLFAGRMQLAPIVRPAFPGAADDHARQRVFGGQQQQPSAGLEHSREFPERRLRIGK